MNPLKRITAIVIAIAILSCLSGSAAIAGTGSDSDSPKTGDTATKSAPSRDAKATEKVKADMLKLLADAKAGKVAPAPQQFPRSAKNNLSTGAKIGIAAAIGGAVFLIWMFHELNKD